MENRSTSKNFVNRTPKRTIKDDMFIIPEIIVKYNERIDNKLNLNVETWADIDRKTYMCWGDYWVKQKMMKAFEDLGINIGVKPSDADVTFYLWGSPFPQRKSYPFFYNPDSFNVMWFYSNPNKMRIEELIKYNLVFCLSSYYLELIKKYDIVSRKPLFSCTDFDKPVLSKYEKDIDILFVGNARGGSQFGRQAIEWLDVPDDLVVKVYGHKWYNHDYVKKWYAERYWPYEELNLLYNRAKITLVDGHQDMNDLGFVQMKIFDILASGGFVISLFNIGMFEIFGDIIPQFRTKKEMNDLIKYFLNNETEREKLSEEGYKIAVRNRYVDRAKTVIKEVKKRMKK